MTTMRKLNANDYDELLFVLNRAFGNIYQREMDFTRELPRMWVRDDEYMGKHIGMFEDGKLCKYSKIDVDGELPYRLMEIRNRVKNIITEEGITEVAIEDI